MPDHDFRAMTQPPVVDSGIDVVRDVSPSVENLTVPLVKYTGGTRHGQVDVGPGSSSPNRACSTSANISGNG